MMAVVALLAAIRLGEATFTRLSVDALLSGNRTTFLLAASTHVALGLTAALLMGAWRYRRTAWAGEMGAGLRGALAGRLLGLPMEEAEQYDPGEVGSRITTDVTAASGVLTAIYELARDAVLFASAATYMVLLDWRVGAASLLICPLAGLLAERLSRPLSALAEEVQRGYAELAGFSGHVLAGTLAVKVFGLAGEMTRRFTGLNTAVLRRNVRLLGRTAWLEAAIWLCAGAPLFVPFGYGGYLVFTGAMSPGTIFAILYLSNYTRGPMAYLGTQVGEIRKCLGSTREILDLIDAPTRPAGVGPATPPVPAATPPTPAPTPPAPVAAPAPPGPGAATRLPVEKPPLTAAGRDTAVTVRNLTFSYRGAATPTLREVSFSVPRGVVTFVVGPSGSGKTTLLKILAGLYDVHPGVVFLEGEDIHLLRARGRVAAVYVPQDPWLFPWTVRENLTLADRQATDEEVARALATACADFVWAMPRGLDTLVAEAGTSLSGGQKARLCIARALLAHPAVLLLDEPAAHLDAVTERELMARLRGAMCDRALVIVSHRLSQVADEDRVTVLEQGCVVQEGLHRELVETPGPYRDMYRTSLHAGGERGCMTGG